MSYQNILQFIVWYFEPVHTISLCTHKRTVALTVVAICPATCNWGSPTVISSITVISLRILCLV